MNATRSNRPLPKTFRLPYHLGVYLAVNAVPDCCLVVDGMNCSMPKADFIYGNHDLRSTLFSHDGAHRLVYTMAKPVKQGGNPEEKLSVLLEAAARSGRFGAVLLTALPFLKLSGMDYEGLAAGIKGGAPVAEVPADSMEADWLRGYDNALLALANSLPVPARRRGTVALAGYLMDRNEGDHAANIAELGRLLAACGLELACVFPSGIPAKELSRALAADLVVSLPYGRRAARAIAARSGAKLIETGLPMGAAGTAAWLARVCLAAGLKKVPGAALALERQAAAELRPALDVLAHRNAVFAGDPYLFAAFSGFASELGLRLQAAFLDSDPVRTGTSLLPGKLLFSPDTAAAAAVTAGLAGYDRPDLLVGNSFAASEGFAPGLPLAELGFPSYGHHCLGPEPFLGYAGAPVLAGRLVNALLHKN
jgi:nitrogenase molybdenum-iron protein alpha/beta subunit